jgi:hypothetical protein
MYQQCEKSMTGKSRAHDEDGNANRKAIDY